MPSAAPSGSNRERGRRVRNLGLCYSLGHGQGRRNGQPRSGIGGWQYCDGGRPRLNGGNAAPLHRMDTEARPSTSLRYAQDERGIDRRFPGWERQIRSRRFSVPAQRHRSSSVRWRWPKKSCATTARYCERWRTEPEDPGPPSVREQRRPHSNGNIPPNSTPSNRERFSSRPRLTKTRTQTATAARRHRGQEAPPYRRRNRTM